MSDGCSHSHEHKLAQSMGEAAVLGMTAARLG